jgi:hypothetical protein
MKKLNEIKNLLNKVYKNKQQILEGIRNKVVKDEFVESVAKARYAICNSCAYMDKEGSNCAVPGTQPCCGACGCSLSLKLRSLSSECGAVEKGEEAKWEAVVTPEEEDNLENLQ